MTWYVLALRLAGLGWYVALSIVFGVVGGLGLLGSVVAFWGLYKMVQPLLNAAANPSKNDKGSNS